MHNHNEDQPSISLPNLSTWHRVPTGATIPAGTPYAYVYYVAGATLYLDGHFEDIVAHDRSDCGYYTEHPVTPSLPTEDGATILASSGDWPPSALLMREGDCWVTCFGVELPADQIHAWAPVTIGEVVHKS